MTNKENLEKLKYKTKNVYSEITAEQRREMLGLCDEYITFLNNGKTERECLKEAVEMAEKCGFKKFADMTDLKAGDKVYFVNRKKNLMLAVIGSEDIEKGINLVGAHIDSPRLDLKQNPLYESNEQALLKTH